MKASHAPAVGSRSPDSTVLSKRELQVFDSFEFLPARSVTAPISQEIEEFLETQNTSHPFQFPQWAGGSGYFALQRSQGALCWFAQCGVSYPASRLFRPLRILTVNRGPVCDDLDLMEHGLERLLGTARRMGFARVEITPDWAGDFGVAGADMLTRTGWEAQTSGRTTLRLSLTPDCDQLLASFRKVTRYEIRRSEKMEIEIRLASSEQDCQDWLSMYRDMGQVKGFETPDLAHIVGVLRWLRSEPQRGALMLAYNNHKLVGGIVLVRSGMGCWYVLGATSKREPFSAGHLLQWRGIQWAKNMGCLEYDFGGYTEGSSGGTAFFKSGFCDNVVSFPPTNRMIVNFSRQGTAEFLSRLRRVVRL